MRVQEISWWEIGFAWLSANVFGILIGVAAGAMLNDKIWLRSNDYCLDLCLINNPLERMLITGLCIGCFVGIVERLVLPQLSPWWILASTVGWAVGLASAENIDNFQFSGAVAGIIIGVAEWLILRRYVPASYWWIIACAISGLAMPLTVWLPPNLSAYDLFYPLSYIQVGITIGLITAVTLVWLSRLPFDSTKDNELTTD